jgi:hypothetical protein
VGENWLAKRILPSVCFENLFKFFLHFKETKTSRWHYWLTLIILAIEEADIGRIRV